MMTFKIFVQYTRWNKSKIGGLVNVCSNACWIFLLRVVKQIYICCYFQRSLKVISLGKPFNLYYLASILYKLLQLSKLWLQFQKNASTASVSNQNLASRFPLIVHPNLCHCTPPRDRMLWLLRLVFNFMVSSLVKWRNFVRWISY